MSPQGCPTLPSPAHVRGRRSRYLIRASFPPALRARPHGPARMCRRGLLIRPRRPSAGARLPAPLAPHRRPPPSPPRSARSAHPRVRHSAPARRHPRVSCARAAHFRASHRPSPHRRTQVPCRPRHPGKPHKTPSTLRKRSRHPAQTKSSTGAGTGNGPSDGTGAPSTRTGTSSNGTGTLTPQGARPSSADLSGQCPDASLQPNEANLERVRAAVVCLVNRERAAHGEVPLQANNQLEQAAQSHTESMAYGNYFDHVGPSGDTALSRMRASGYIYSSRIGFEVGENIGWGTLWEGTPRAVVAAWMASTGHRENILDAHFRDTAVGVSPHVPSSMSRGQT